MTTYTDLAAANFDLSVFRTYLADQYGQDLEFGMSANKFSRLISDTKVYAKLSGRKYDENFCNEIWQRAVADEGMVQDILTYEAESCI
jgi:hypothetical protein